MHYVFHFFRWKTRDILQNDNTRQVHVALLVQLNPWTQYAVFVQTYMTSNTQFGAMSKLVYFRTAASSKYIVSKLVQDICMCEATWLFN